MPNAKSLAIRPEGRGNKGRSQRESNNTLAYSRTQARATVQCAWCDRRFDSTDEYLTGRVRCARCGVATTSPWPSDEQLSAAYADWYRPQSGRFSGLGDKVLRRTRSALADRLHRILPPGPVLDVGPATAPSSGPSCAAAVKPSASSRTHPDRTSVTPRSKRWTETGRRSSSGIRLSTSASLPGLWVMRQRSLSPGGRLVIAVPNATSLQARVFGDRWLALDLPRHLVHLSPSALLSKVEALGLRVERVSYMRGGQVVFGWVHGFVGKLPGHPDLYDAIRRSEARQATHSPVLRLYALTAAVAALPFALAATAVEVAARSGGTIYIEARREPAPEESPVISGPSGRAPRPAASPWPLATRSR